MIGLPADYYPIELAIESRRQGGLERVSEALAQMDVRLEADFELQQCLLQVRSEADLVAAMSILDRLCPGLTLGEPQVAYRERLGCAAEIDHTHKKQSGGTGQFARVKILFEPLEPGSGFIFESAITGGAVPEAFIPGVSGGLGRARENGLLAGYPVTDFRAKLIDGAWHDNDSSALAFEIAARGAFRELKAKGDPRLMEPLVALTISALPEQAGSVRQLLGQRGAAETAHPQGQPATELEFTVRLVAALGLGQTLMDHCPVAELVETRFAGMRDVPWQYPGDGGDDAPPVAMRLRA